MNIKSLVLDMLSLGTPSTDIEEEKSSRQLNLQVLKRARLGDEKEPAKELEKS